MEESEKLKRPMPPERVRIPKQRTTTSSLVATERSLDFTQVDVRESRIVIGFHDRIRIRVILVVIARAPVGVQGRFATCTLAQRARVERDVAYVDPGDVLLELEQVVKQRSAKVARNVGRCQLLDGEVVSDACGGPLGLKALKEINNQIKGNQ